MQSAVPARIGCVSFRNHEEKFGLTAKIMLGLGAALASLDQRA
jgi:hypothetical protein